MAHTIKIARVDTNLADYVPSQLGSLPLQTPIELDPSPVHILTAELHNRASPELQLYVAFAPSSKLGLGAEKKVIFPPVGALRGVHWITRSTEYKIYNSMNIFVKILEQF